MITIRPERLEDAPAVHEVNRLAFGRAAEAELVDALIEALRRAAGPWISLVAEAGGRVVGHIFFSPVTIEGEAGPRAGESGSPPAMGLGPMAVLPGCQNRGIGSELARAGLEACRRAGHLVVVVLGHPRFYPRFGFVPARPRGLRCEYDVSDDVFMVAELEPGALAGCSGLVRYHPEFARVD
jgi:putative acetyltransferase